MTVTDALPPPSDARVDPFAVEPAAPARPRPRPRLMSYVGRWGRARRWFPEDAVRVLDIGSSFGYGMAALQGSGPAARVVAGVERDPDHLARAAERFPWLTVLQGDATDLPVAQGVADAVTMLDIVEHIDRPDLAIAEAHRVLRPGGVLIVSVPHRGLLHHLDALNVYERLRKRRPSWPPLAPAAQSGGHEHHHFTVAELEGLLAPRFTVDRMTRTGIGAQEFVALAIILFERTRVPILPRLLGALHVLVYFVDDAVPLGRLGYHLTVRARPVPAA